MADASLKEFVDQAFNDALTLTTSNRNRLRVALGFWLDGQLRRLANEAGLPVVHPEWEPELRRNLSLFADEVKFVGAEDRIAVEVPQNLESTWLLLRFGNTTLEGFQDAVSWVVAAANS